MRAIKAQSPSLRAAAQSAGLALVLATACGCDATIYLGFAGIGDPLSDGGTHDAAAPTNANTAAAFTSGTRLRRKVLDLGNGNTVFAGWFDTMLKIDCAYLPASDQSYRCLPVTDLGAPWFADASCTQTVAFALCSPTPKYAKSGVLSADTCQPRVDHYNVVKLLAAHTGDLYAGALGSCQMSQPADATPFYDTTPEPPSTFVKGVPRQAMIGDQLEATILDGEDGSHQTYWQWSGPILDTKRAAPCTVQTVTGGTASGDAVVCLTSQARAATTNVYADPMCSMPLVAVKAACPDLTMTLAPKTNDLCHLQLRTLGAKLPETMVYAAQGMCVASPTTPDWSYFPVAGAAADGAVPTLTRTAVGGGYLQPVELLGKDGAPLAVDPNRAFDRTRNEDCVPMRSAKTNDLRCIPVSAVLLSDTRHFFDDQCTKEFALETNACVHPQMAIRTASACSTSATAIYSLGTPMMVMTTYEQSSETPGCQMTIDAVPVAAYPIGVMLDPSTYPAVSARTE